jgi:formylglycine-generating enzyme required for sulfatase activity
MPRIFISHRNSDDAAIDVLSAWLTARGYTDHFIDHRDIEAGASWDAALRRNASRAELMILYVTPGWLASEECFAEYRASFYGDKTVVPLLVGGLRAQDLEPTARARFETLCASVQGIALDGLPPEGFTAEQIERAIQRVSKAARAARRQRIAAGAGLVAAVALVTLLALGLTFPGVVAETMEKRRIDRGFAMATQTDAAFHDCTGDALCPEMVPLPAAAGYEIGHARTAFANEREGPVTPVDIPAFAVSRTEVTKQQWRACVLSTRRAEPDAPRCKELVYSEAVADEPVETVSWHDVQAYVAWLNLRIGDSPDGPYRLLSEAEWEYAARGGTRARTLYSWGPSLDGACLHANVLNAEMPEALDVRRPGIDCSGTRDNHVLLSPVASYRANTFGLFDTAGNVSEWVADCWHDSHANRPAEIGAGPWVSDAPENCDRVLKGGSWIGHRDLLRPAARVGLAPDVLGFNIGLRIARDLGP